MGAKGKARMKEKDVWQQMKEIERSVYAPQSWWGQLRRLLEQAQATDEAAKCDCVQFMRSGTHDARCATRRAEIT
jgi:hypothetical protein